MFLMYFHLTIHLCSETKISAVVNLMTETAH